MEDLPDYPDFMDIVAWFCDQQVRAAGVGLMLGYKDRALFLWDTTRQGKEYARCITIEQVDEALSRRSVDLSCP